LLRSGHARAILRLKGLVALSDDPARPLLVHGVGHTLSAPVRLAEWPDADHRSRLVLIVRDLDPAFVGTLWDAFL
ncbi:GTP-binding protein, partial [Stenotrophomonas maltophilia]